VLLGPRVAAHGEEAPPCDVPEPEWSLDLYDFDFCPMMDCDPPPPRTGPSVRMGTTDRCLCCNRRSDLIRRSISRHRNRIRACYELALLHDRGLAGRMEARFVIDPSGEVSYAAIERSTISSDELGQCIVEALRAIPFRRDPGCTSIIHYPFVFRRRPAPARRAVVLFR